MKTEFWEPRWPFRETSFVILSVIALIIGANLFLEKLGAREFFLETEYRSIVTLILFLVQEILLIAPVYFFVMRPYGVTLHDLGMRRVGWRETLRWIFRGFMAIILFNVVFVWITSFLEKDLPGFSQQESHIPLFGSNPEDIVVAIFVLVILAPIIEEILFRGFLLQSFLGKFKPWMASLLTAGFFSVIHFEFQSFSIILFLAFVLNWIYMRTRSIIPCIGFHMGNNALAFLVEWLLWSGNGS